MVARIAQLFGREVRGLHEAAYLLGVFAMFSQLLALIRDRLFASSFGASGILDVYYASFKIPDLLFVSIASFVSIYVLIPMLAEKLDRSDIEAKRFINGIFSVFFAVLVLVSGIVALIAPYVISRVVPGFDLAQQAEVVMLTRILLLQPFLLGLSNLLASVTQIKGRFALYALSPVLYNLGIIGGLLLLYPLIGVSGLAWGVVLGAVLHAGIQIPFIYSQKLLPRITFRINAREVGNVVMLSLPRTLALAMNQIVILVFIAIGSTLAAGSIAVFQLASNLQSVPLAIIGVSYSVAAFPTLAKLFSSGQQTAFLSQIITAARHILFWSIPAVVLVIVLRAQLVRVILGTGEFGWGDTRLTAAALALFMLSLIEQMMVLLLVRGFYAAGNTRIPLYINVLSSGIAIASAYFFLAIFNSNELFRTMIETLLRVEDLPGTEVLMLPLAFTVGMGINALLLMILFQRKYGEVRAIVRPTVSVSFVASLIAGVVSYGVLSVVDDVVDINTFQGIFIQGLSAGLAGLMAWAIALTVFKSRELDEAMRALRRRSFFKQKPLVPEDGGATGNQ